MAAEEFLTHFEKLNTNKEKINIQDFKNYFSTKTPIKMKMIYSQDIKDSIKQARNCIIGNLFINPYFLKANELDQKSIKEICSLLKNTESSANDNQIAHLLFLLHLSKSNLKNVGRFQNFFNNFNSIDLKNCENESWYNECNGLFNSLITNKIIKQIINKVIKEISSKDASFDCSVNITFFTSSTYPYTVNGFAGINQVYISKTEIEKLLILINLSCEYSSDDKNLILKLYLTRLFLHELTHVILRKTLNDFNLSSPNIFESTHQEADASCLIEAGILAEKELFGGKIDWKKTVAFSNVNVVYCSTFLQNLLNNQKTVFSIELSRAIISDLPQLIMAVDCDLELPPLLEFE